MENTTPMMNGTDVVDGRSVKFNKLKVKMKIPGKRIRKVTTCEENKEGMIMNWMDAWSIFETLQQRTSRADHKVTTIKGLLEKNLR